MPLDPVGLMDAKPADGHVQLWHSHPAVASPVKPAGRPRAASEPLVRGLATAPDTPHAERGVTLAALLKLGASVPRHCTTADVVQRYIKPATAARGCTYYALLPPDQVAPPTYFVVHSWAAPFHHLLDQLRARFQPPRGGPAANPYLWLDFVALPHHQPLGSPRPPRELGHHLSTVAALTATVTTLVSLGPHAEALSDLPCLHALAALAAKHHRHPHLQFLTALPPALPLLIDAFATLDITAARAPSALDRRATLDDVAALAGTARPGGPPLLPARAADPAAGAAAALNPLLQRVLADCAAQWAAQQAAAPAAAPADVADCRFLQAAVLLAVPRVGPRDALLESAEHLAGHCLSLRVATAMCAGAAGRPAAAAGAAAARQLLAEVMRQREAAAAAQPGGEACEHRLGAALALLEEAAHELLVLPNGGGPAGQQQAARALVAAAEVCNSLCRYHQAQDLASRALGLLAAAASATTAAVQPADRAAANAALGHSLLQVGDPDAAEPPLHAAAHHHAAAAPLPTSAAPYCRAAAPALRDYSAALLRLGRVAEATHWARRALSAAEAAHGPEEPVTADCMEALALALLEHRCPSSGPPSSSSTSSSASSQGPCGCAPLDAPPSPCAPQPCSSPPSPTYLPHPAFHPSSPVAAPSPAATPPNAHSYPPSIQLCGSASSATSATSTTSTYSYSNSCATTATGFPSSAPLALTPLAADPRCSEAEDLLRRRLRVMLQHHGRGHPVVVRCSHTLAQALHRTQQHAEAERIYLGVLQCLREALPPPPPATPPPPVPAPMPFPSPFTTHPTCYAPEPAGSELEGAEPMAVALAAEASWGGCVEVVADPMLLCGEAELAGMKTLLGGARSSSSTLDEALWRAEHDTCCAAEAAAPPCVLPGVASAGGGLLEGCPARPRLADVLRELAAVYDDWGRAADAELCRRQAAALMPQRGMLL